MFAHFEEIAALMMTNSATMVPHGFQGWTPFASGKEDGVFGLAEGEGNVMLIPLPKVKPELGPRSRSSELKGIQREHAGHVSALEASHAVFQSDDQAKREASWALNMWVQRDSNHVLPISGEADPGLPQSKSIIELFQEELDPPQMELGALRQIGTYGPQYTATGVSWGVFGTSQFRGTDINEPMSQGIAGQRKVQRVSDLRRSRIDTAFQKQNQELA